MVKQSVYDWSISASRRTILRPVTMNKYNSRERPVIGQPNGPGHRLAGNCEVEVVAAAAVEIMVRQSPQSETRQHNQDTCYPECEQLQLKSPESISISTGM